MPGQNDYSLTQAQLTARDQLVGLIGKKHVGGRTMCCLIGSQGAGKTYLAKSLCSDEAFGRAKRIAVNRILLSQLPERYHEVLTFPPKTFQNDLRRFKNALHKEVYQIIREHMLEDGLTIIDHLELLFAIGVDPVTTWYNDAVGQRRVLLVFTGRMMGKQCKIGHHTLTHADQHFVVLEGIP